MQKNPDRYQEALTLYDSALELSTVNKRIYILHRASLLFSMKRYRECIEILTAEVSNSRPESSVYFLLGKSWACLGEGGKAIEMMTMAQDYSAQKSSSLIKDAIEKLYESAPPNDEFPSLS